MVVVEEWAYKGRRCKITRNEEIGHYCGYIQTGLRGITHGADSKLWRLIDVHGGITYGVDEEGWLGFDCAHARDICVNEEDKVTHGGDIYDRSDKDSHIWTVEKVKEEVEDLADQWSSLENVVHAANKFEYE